MDAVPLSRAAQILGLSREQCARRIFRQELKAELIDGRWMVDVASLATFQQKEQQSRAPEAAHA
jgi:hypothetical protein